MTSSPFKIIRNPKALGDLREIRDYTLRNHGNQTTKAYMALIRQAFKDIKADPLRAGSRERPEIDPHIRSYHIALSKDRAPHKIKKPRHVILYFLPKEDEILILRVKHDASDLVRHLPENLEQD